MTEKQRLSEAIGYAKILQDGDLVSRQLLRLHKALNDLYTCREFGCDDCRRTVLEALGEDGL